MMLPNNASIVILANDYNPSIVSKEWLSKKGIVTDPVRNFVHTPVFSLVENDDFSFLVDEKRLQIIIKKISDKNLELSSNMARSFINFLPETPYKNIGFNYGFSFLKRDCKQGRLFSVKNENVKKLFSDTYELGTTIVFKFGKFLVNFVYSPRLNSDNVIMNFNFNSEFTGVEEATDRLSQMNNTLKKVDEIVKGLS